ncbi:Hsp20/alpha crystallin family protein [Novipirellula artificiosorum]|uniref:Spore protein SP21 n=1 Tax=Novipirellula artificiosorum TaxID=2528016 RepID=A0A5C6DQY6_9BACT|nr:Hsp20/alpha crystallin family protein [Novipirellula artificiosorum]TWU39683.1 Spore protein SP21 [Novipirellula artificiosorum]
MTTTMSTAEKQSADVSKSETTYQSTFIPRFDIWEGDEELTLFGDLPGVAVDDLDIRFENRELTLHGKVTPRFGGEYLYSEYGIGDFHRTFAIGEAIDGEKIYAEIHGGVLTVHLPKTEKLKPRKIEVKAN